MVIANFKNDGKEYVFQYENKEIKYAINENGTINYSLTEEERKMMAEVFSKIIVSSNPKNYIRLNQINYNNKLFQTMYDKKTNNKFFLQIIDNKFYIPIEEDNKYLLKKFCDTTVLYDNNNQNQNDEYYQKEVTLKNSLKKIIVTVVLSSTLLSVALNSSVVENLFQEDMYSEEVEEIPEREFSEELYDEIIASLFSNPNISGIEKEAIQASYNLIKENAQYMDIDVVKDRLSTLKIEYRKANTISNALGTYYTSDNRIVIGRHAYQANFEGLSNDEKHTFYHEVSHVFAKDSLSIGQGLQEAINETMTYEYMDNNTSIPRNTTYEDERLCLYALCEIVGTDCFRKMHFRNDLESFISELTNIIDDNNMPYILLDDINLLSHFKETDREIYNNKKNEIYDIISKYYQEKYNSPIEENETMMTYLNSGFVKKDIETPYATKIIQSFIPKGYFYSKYIEEHKSITGVITVSPEMAIATGVMSRQDLEKYGIPVPLDKHPTPSRKPLENSNQLETISNEELEQYGISPDSTYEEEKPKTR